MCNIFGHTLFFVPEFQKNSISLKTQKMDNFSNPKIIRIFVISYDIF